MLRAFRDTLLAARSLDGRHLAPARGADGHRDECHPHGGQRPPLGVVTGGMLAGAGVAPSVLRPVYATSSGTYQ
jgi:hypothetical protein